MVRNSSSAATAAKLSYGLTVGKITRFSSSLAQSSHELKICSTGDVAELSAQKPSSSGPAPRGSSWSSAYHARSAHTAPPEVFGRGSPVAGNPAFRHIDPSLDFGSRVVWPQATAPAHEPWLQRIYIRLCSERTEGCLVHAPRATFVSQRAPGTDWRPTH